MVLGALDTALLHTGVGWGGGGGGRVVKLSTDKLCMSLESSAVQPTWRFFWLVFK